uniref:Putative reverse transcriptase domain-containing protein n=1 Tax=Tanacetum cinerariifolium TaxID=118510 RepID=A0A699HQX5_TANCI|nr:putative reverse transcriptase domain-containing protein [Tanacetum cinerariifolium]
MFFIILMTSATWSMVPCTIIVITQALRLHHLRYFMIASLQALRLHHLRHFVITSFDHPSDGLKLEIVNSLAYRLYTKQLRRSSKIKNQIQAAHDGQKSYTNVWRKPPECQVGDKVMLKLSPVHSTFHVSNLKKCLSNKTLVIPLDEIQIDDKLHFIEEPVEIMDRQVKHLKQSHIPIVKSDGTQGEVLNSHGNVKTSYLFFTS